MAIIKFRKLKPQFSLAALMLVVTAVALGMWVYVVLIPALRDRERRTEFETAVRQLKAGPSRDLFQLLPHDGTLSTTKSSDAHRRYVEIVPFYFDRYWYCVYFVLDPSRATASHRMARFPDVQGVDFWDEVRVYRLEPAPRDYETQTKEGRSMRTDFSTQKEIPPSSKEQYLRDFFEIISDRETSNLGIDHELIYFDKAPSAK